MKGVSLNIKQGEVVLIIGPSGSGKSTLLRSINRLEHVSSGEIWIEDKCVTDPAEDIRKIREEVGMVFQSFNLFNHLTALNNITLALRIVKKMSKEQADEAEEKLLKRVGLSEKEKLSRTSFPEASSRGWQLQGLWQ